MMLYDRVIKILYTVIFLMQYHSFLRLESFEWKHSEINEKILNLKYKSKNVLLLALFLNIC